MNLVSLFNLHSISNLEGKVSPYAFEILGFLSVEDYAHLTQVCKSLVAAEDLLFVKSRQTKLNFADWKRMIRKWPEFHSDRLKELDFAGSDIDDEGLKKIADQFPKLNILHLHWCKKITDQGFTQMGRFKSLQVINLCSCDGFTNEGLKQLPRSIVSLYLYWCDQIGGDGFVENLPPNLKELGLTEYVKVVSRISPHFRKLPLPHSTPLQEIYIRR